MRRSGSADDRILTENATPDIPGLPPFTGGFAGAFAYDFYKYTETTLQMNNPNPDSLNDADLMSFRTIAAFDHQMEKLYLITNIPARTEEADYPRSGRQAFRIRAAPRSLPRLRRSEAIDHRRNRQRADIEAYGQKVEKAKEYIRAGDIFQVVPSNRIRIEAGSGCLLFPVYERLRAENPSPYMYYLNFGDFEAAGSSPETLIRKTGTCLLTVPIAGTRPRGADEETDTSFRTIFSQTRRSWQNTTCSWILRETISEESRRPEVSQLKIIFISEDSNGSCTCVRR